MTDSKTPVRAASGTAGAGLTRRQTIVLAALTCGPLPLLSIAATVVPLPDLIERVTARLIPFVAAPLGSDGSAAHLFASPSALENGSGSSGDVLGSTGRTQTRDTARRRSSVRAPVRDGEPTRPSSAPHAGPTAPADMPPGDGGEDTPGPAPSSPAAEEPPAPATPRPAPPPEPTPLPPAPELPLPELPPLPPIELPPLLPSVDVPPLPPLLPTDPLPPLPLP